MLLLAIATSSNTMWCMHARHVLHLTHLLHCCSITRADLARSCSSPHVRALAVLLMMIVLDPEAASHSLRAVGAATAAASSTRPAHLLELVVAQCNRFGSECRVATIADKRAAVRFCCCCARSQAGTHAFGMSTSTPYSHTILALLQTSSKAGLASTGQNWPGRCLLQASMTYTMCCSPWAFLASRASRPMRCARHWARSSRAVRRMSPKNARMQLIWWTRRCKTRRRCLARC
jgi:hypothetical protein